MTIGDRIKQRRLAIGLTVEDLAYKLGKNRATIYRYESNDIKNLPTNVLEPLAEALYTTPAYLMGWDDNPDDWERIANDSGICPPNDYDGSPESWYKSKMTAEKDYEKEEKEYANYVFNDTSFRRHAESYRLLNDINKKKVTNYTENLLSIQRMDDEQNRYFAADAAHERTDIDFTEEDRKADNDMLD